MFCYQLLIIALLCLGLEGQATLLGSRHHLVLRQATAFEIQRPATIRKAGIKGNVVKLTSTAKWCRRL